jgi:hypothetical protein
MAMVQTKFSRLTAVTVGPGVAETAMLSQGVLNTDYKGTLSFGAGTLVAGDVIRVTAGLTVVNNQPPGFLGSCRLRLYLNPAFNNPCADTGAFSINWNQNNPLEVIFAALITIRTTGASGTGYCDALLHVLPALGGTPYFILSGSQSFAISTVPANSIDPTAILGIFGAVTLQQCSVEYLPSP